MMLNLGFATQIEKLKHLLLGDAAGAAASDGSGEEEDRQRQQEHSRPQVALFTATMPKPLRAVAASWLQRPERVAFGALPGGGNALKTSADGTSQEPTISATIAQVVQVCAEHKKPAKLAKHLEAVRAAGASQRHAPRVLIFCNRIKTVRFVAKHVASLGFKTAQLHGERSQSEREQAVREFRGGKVQVLVASDVAARGLDIRGLPYVLNYDFPTKMETYVHRVGRTGRLAASGHAFSFLTREMAAMAAPVLQLLTVHGQAVDPNLVKLAEAYAVAAEKLGLGAKPKGAKPAGRPAAAGEEAEEEEEEEAEEEGEEDEEESEEEDGERGRKVAKKVATEDVLHALDMKSRADKKRDKAQEARRAKKTRGAEAKEGTAGAAAPAGVGLSLEDAQKEFQAAKKFSGARAGFVFKRGGLGVGYYVDRPPHLAAQARAAAQRAAKAAAAPKAKPLLPGRLKQLRRGRGESSDDEGDEGGVSPPAAKAKSKALPGRLRKKLAKERAGSGGGGSGGGRRPQGRR